MTCTLFALQNIFDSKYAYVHRGAFVDNGIDYPSKMYGSRAAAQSALDEMLHGVARKYRIVAFAVKEIPEMD